MCAGAPAAFISWSALCRVMTIQSPPTPAPYTCTSSLAYSAMARSSSSSSCMAPRRARALNIVAASSARLHSKIDKLLALFSGPPPPLDYTGIRGVPNRRLYNFAAKKTWRNISAEVLSRAVPGVCPVGFYSFMKIRHHSYRRTMASNRQRLAAFSAARSTARLRTSLCILPE